MDWEIAANIAEVITSISLVVAIVQLIREKGSENTSAFFYLHQYLSQEQFSIARKKVRTELFKKDYAEWTDEDREQANRVCASYDQAGILISGKVISKNCEGVFEFVMGHKHNRSIRVFGKFSK